MVQAASGIAECTRNTWRPDFSLSIFVFVLIVAYAVHADVCRC